MHIKKKIFLILFLIVVFTYIVYMFSDSLKVVYINGLDHNNFILLFYTGVLVYLIVEKIKIINFSFFKPNLFLGTFFFVLSTTLLLLSNLGSILILKDLALLMFLISIIFYLGGFYLFYHFFLILLFILIPSGVFESFITHFSIYLQLITSFLTSCFLNVIGIFHIYDGIYLHLLDITLIVEQSCNGANQIILLIIFTLIKLNRLSDSTLSLRILLVTITFLIGLVLNSLRITIISLLSAFLHDDYLHGPANILYTSTIFVIGILIIFYIIHKLSPEYNKINLKKDYIAFYQIKPFSQILIISLIIISFLLLFFFKPDPVYANQSEFKLNESIINYKTLDERIREKSFMIKNPSLTINNLYVNNNFDSIIVYIAYTAKQTQQSEIINHNNFYLYKKSHPVQLSSGQIINTLWYEDIHHSGRLYFWYMIDDQVYNSPILGKIATIKNGLYKFRTNGALVVVWFLAPAGEELSNIEYDQQFLAALLPEVQKMLN